MRKETMLVLGMLVTMSLVGLAIAAEQSASAQVQVSEYVSVTITPCSTTLSFGTGNPGDTNLPLSCQSNNTAGFTVTNEAVSNKAVSVKTKADNLGANSTSISVSNMKFDESNARSSPTTMSSSYQTSTASLSTNSTAGVWYWLDIPSGASSGTYAASIYVKAE